MICFILSVCVSELCPYYVSQYRGITSLVVLPRWVNLSIISVYSSEYSSTPRRPLEFSALSQAFPLFLFYLAAHVVVYSSATLQIKLPSKDLFSKTTSHFASAILQDCKHDIRMSSSQLPHERLKRFKSQVNVGSDDFSENYQNMLATIKKLNDTVVEMQAQGSERRIAAHRKQKKLLGRERLDLILDEGSPFLEIGSIVGYGHKRVALGSGCVAGIGVVR